jgi:hypothetical protein
MEICIPRQSSLRVLDRACLQQLLRPNGRPAVDNPAATSRLAGIANTRRPVMVASCAVV